MKADKHNKYFRSCASTVKNDGFHAQLAQQYWMVNNANDLPKPMAVILIVFKDLVEGFLKEVHYFLASLLQPTLDPSRPYLNMKVIFNGPPFNSTRRWI